MSTSRCRLIIDSHLDLSWSALSWNRDLPRELADINASESRMRDDDARGNATVSFPELRRAGIAVCLGTFLARAKYEYRPEKGFPRASVDYATQDIAYSIAQGQLAYYRLMEKKGEIRLIGTRRQLDAHWKVWLDASDAARMKLPIGVILAMEGADPIVEPLQTQEWWDAGLRSVGIAHYGKSHYGVGTGDNGPLTEKGIQLLKEFDRLGMIYDATHSSDKSFFHALEVFRGPVMASHNNCRSLVPGDRQFSDEQIKLLIERKAVIGAVLDAWMLTPGWVIDHSKNDNVKMKSVADHIDYVCQLAGNTNHAAIGSDLDGGYGHEQCPGDFKTINDLHKLEPLLKDRGYKEADINKIFHGNWLEFFRRTLPN